MFYVYILRSDFDSSYYIGHSQDINARLDEHNFGRTGYTKLKRPWKLVYKEEYLMKSEAVKRERYLKSLKSRKALEKIIGGVGP